VSPRVGPRPPGVRYWVVVTQISDHGAEVTFDHTADAYIAAVADLSETGTRITATVDHDGDRLLRERLVIYIADATPALTRIQPQRHAHDRKRTTGTFCRSKNVELLRGHYSNPTYRSVIAGLYCSRRTSS
jgi:hypothetical protein